MYLYIYIYLYLFLYIYISIYLYIYVYLYIYLHQYIYIHTYLYISIVIGITIGRGYVQKISAHTPERIAQSCFHLESPLNVHVRSKGGTNAMPTTAHKEIQWLKFYVPPLLLPRLASAHVHCRIHGCL